MGSGVGAVAAERSHALGRLGDDDDRQRVDEVLLNQARDPLGRIGLAAAAGAAGIGDRYFTVALLGQGRRDLLAGQRQRRLELGDRQAPEHLDLAHVEIGHT